MVLRLESSYRVDHIGRNHMDSPRSICHDMGIDRNRLFDHGYRGSDIQLDHQSRYIQPNILRKFWHILLHNNRLHLWHYNWIIGILFQNQPTYTGINGPSSRPNLMVGSGTFGLFRTFRPLPDDRSLAYFITPFSSQSLINSYTYLSLNDLSPSCLSRIIFSTWKAATAPSKRERIIYSILKRVLFQSSKCFWRQVEHLAIFTHDSSKKSFYLPFIHFLRIATVESVENDVDGESRLKVKMNH